MATQPEMDEFDGSGLYQRAIENPVEKCNKDKLAFSCDNTLDVYAIYICSTKVRVSACTYRRYTFLPSIDR
jgi:hypothetical protein